MFQNRLFTLIIERLLEFDFFHILYIHVLDDVIYLFYVVAAQRKEIDFSKENKKNPATYFFIAFSMLFASVFLLVTHALLCYMQLILKDDNLCSVNPDYIHSKLDYCLCYLLKYLLHTRGIYFQTCLRQILSYWRIVYWCSLATVWDGICLVSVANITYWSSLDVKYS